MALALLTLLLISAAIYAAVRLLPGGPTWGDEAGRSPVQEAFLARYHAGDSIPAGYARWIGELMHLDLGTSLSVRPGRPVVDLVSDALPYTLALGLLAFVLTLGLSLPLGIASAWRPASAAGRSATVFLYLLHALPAFWIALALQHLFASTLGWLPALGPAPLQGTAGPAYWASLATHWILPAAAVSLGSLAFIMRFTRDTLLEETGRPYANASRSRGASEARVLIGHALPNTGVPLVALAGLMLPGVVSGSVVVEAIFALPGLGRLYFMAASARDYPLVMSLSLLTAAATLAATLLADLAHRAIDPRLRDGDLEREGR